MNKYKLFLVILGLVICFAIYAECGFTDWFVEPREPTFREYDTKTNSCPKCACTVCPKCKLSVIKMRERLGRFKKASTYVMELEKRISGKQLNLADWKCVKKSLNAQGNATEMFVYLVSKAGAEEISKCYVHKEHTESWWNIAIRYIKNWAYVTWTFIKQQWLMLTIGFVSTIIGIFILVKLYKYSCKQYDDDDFVN